MREGLPRPPRACDDALTTRIRLLVRYDNGTDTPSNDLQQAAGEAGLRYVNSGEAGISRRRSGKGFTYRDPAGATIRDRAALKRIRSLAVPPAWTDVWICTLDNGHIQATGRDVRSRKQYRYHPLFRELCESTKFEHMLEFARLLPKIRARVSEHMAMRGLPREKVLATTVHLLETTLIRVGNGDYARRNRSYGITTLRQRHVEIEGSELRFRFTGKGGKEWRLRLSDRRVAKIVKACQELPGQELLQYVDAAGERHPVTSGDVNAYLREISGADVTAKDFRTWAATVGAALALARLGAAASATEAGRNVRDVIVQVAARLGNTPTICRKCYVHPEIIEAYAAGALVLETGSEAEIELRQALQSLQREETAVLALLRERLRPAA